MRLLIGDECLERGLGYELPSVTAVREFLERFHDQKLEKLRPEREEQKSFIFPSSEPVAALQEVQSGLVRRIAKLYEKQGQPQRMATVDQDATIIESHKQAAYYHYEEGRGYQPMVAVWAEADLVLADEFRDGNVPAKQDPLTCAKLAFAALPETIQQRYFRGDSACHENDLLEWLKHPDREAEPGGRIVFAVSAVMSEPLAEALRKVEEADGRPSEQRGRRHVAAVGGGGLCARGQDRSTRTVNRCGMWDCACSSRRGCCLRTGPTGIFTR